MNKMLLGSHAPERFKVPGDSTESIFLNPSRDQFILIHRPSMAELAAAIEEYASIRMEDRWLEINRVGATGGGKILMALALSEKRFYNISHDAVVCLFKGQPFAPKCRELHQKSLEEQREFIEVLKPTSIAQMLAMFPDRRIDLTGYRYLKETLEASSTPEEFFEALLSHLTGSIAATDYGLGTPKPGYHQQRILEFFGLSLRKGWLLFPFLTEGSGIGLNRALLHRECVGRYFNPAYRPTEADEILERSSTLLGTNTTGAPAHRYVGRLVVCSTYRSIAHSNSAMFDRCIELANSGGATTYRQMGIARKGYNALLKLHAAHYPKAPPQAVLRRPKSSVSLEEFSSFDARITVASPLYHWSEVCSDYIKSLKGSWNNIKKKRTAIGDLVDFLLTLNNAPLRPEHFLRGQVNDYKDDSKTLRNFLRKYSSANANSKLSSISEFFGYVADRLRVEHKGPASIAPSFLNPISFKLDRFSATSRSGSPRKAIGADIMAEMRSVLIEDDYAWSKSAMDDMATVVDGETNSLSVVWCPSATICLFTLLSLPLRGPPASEYLSPR